MATSPVHTSTNTSPKNGPSGSTSIVGHSHSTPSTSAYSIGRKLFSTQSQAQNENVCEPDSAHSRVSSGSTNNNNGNVKNSYPTKNQITNNNTVLCGDKLKKYENNNSNIDVIKQLSKKYCVASDNNLDLNKHFSNSSFNSNKTSNKFGKMVAAGEILNEQQFDPNESSEELKYGPGIVSKLRCRYLSLALRQATAKQRPSINSLRRTTSLNNLLDEEDEDEEIDIDGKIEESNEKNIIKEYVNNVRNSCDSNYRLKNSHNQNLNNSHNGNDYTNLYQNQRNSRSNEKSSESRGAKNRHDSMKRARSVEAILRYDNNAWERDVKKENIANRVSQEYVGYKNREVTIEDKIINARERNDPKPKRLTSLIDEDERPPPDLVKQTLLIFEASANKKRNPVTRPIGEKVAAKVETFKTIISQEKPPVNFPKPTINAKKPNIMPRTTSPKPIISNLYNNINNNNNSEKFAKFMKEKPVLPKLDINIIKNNLETNNKTNGVTSPTSGSIPTKTANFDMPHRGANIKEFSPSSGTDSPIILSPMRHTLSPSPQFDAARKTATSTNLIDSPNIIGLSNKLNNLHLADTSTPKNNMQTAQQLTVKPVLMKSDDNSDSEDLNDDFEEDNDSSDSGEKVKVKRISQNALENIGKAGTTQQFKFSSNNINLISHNNCKALPVPNSVSESKSNGSDKQVKMSNNTSVENTVDISDYVKPIMRDIKAPSVPPPLPPIASARSLLTTREIEKNSINKDMSEMPVVPPRDTKNIGAQASSASNLNVNNTGSVDSTNGTTSAAAAAPKWAVKKKSKNQEPENNTMVFNFSDRKDVPDYIEHDGLILRKKRELPKVGFFLKT